MKTEELLKQALNEHLYRTKIEEVEDCHEYNLYRLVLDNNNITTTELGTISEVVGDYDLQVETKRHGEYGCLLVVLATIDDGQIDEIREQYE